jgi:predicted nuclease of predicted toxin-antitoxin system
MSPMQWLLHGTLTPAVADALKRHEHQTHTVAELDLAPDAPHIDILKSAQQKQWDVMTNDHDLANAPFEHDFYFNRSIVFLQLEGQDVEQDDAVDRLFDRYKRLTPRRLYTVTTTRVKIRQLPGPT